MSRDDGYGSYRHGTVGVGSYRALWMASVMSRLRYFGRRVGTGCMVEEKDMRDTGLRAGGNVSYGEISRTVRLMAIDVNE